MKKKVILQTLAPLMVWGLFGLSAEAAPVRSGSESSLSLPDSSTSSSVLSQKKVKPAVYRLARNNVTLDTAPILVRGIGLSYEYALMRRWTVGPFANMFHMTSESALESTYDVQTYGVKTRYFLLGNRAPESGLYASLALAQVTAKTDVQMSIGTSRKAPGSTTTSEFGGIYGLGYQFVAARWGERSRLTFNLGALYGRGYGFETTAQYVGNNKSDVTTTIRDDLFFEAGLGFMF